MRWFRLAHPRRPLAFLTIGTVMAVLDGTIVNVALPTIGLDQHATAAESIWIVTGYQLAVADPVDQSGCGRSPAIP